MANNLDISTITGINQVGNSYQRKNPIPLDYYSFFNTRADAEDYAKTGAVAYVGQVIAFKESATDATVKVCVIKNEAGDLEALNNVEVKIPGIKQGTYITVTTDANGDYTIAHANASEMVITPETEKKTTFVTEIIRDAQGHITGYKTATVEIPDVRLDEASVDKNTDGEIEVKGFKQAGALTVPQKNAAGTGLEWVTIEGTDTKTVGDDKSIEAAATNAAGANVTLQIKGVDKAEAGKILAADGNGGVEWVDDKDTEYSLAFEDFGNNLVDIHLKKANNDIAGTVSLWGQNGIEIKYDPNDDIIITAPDITIEENEDISGRYENEDSVGVIANLNLGDGHTLCPEVVNVPTKAYVDRLVTGATDYLGTVNSQAELDALKPKRGDFVRVATAFGEYHVSDMLVCETPYNEDNPDTPDDETKLPVSWTVIHGEIDANTWVANSATADGYVTKGAGQANKVWKTDKDGNPGWREDEDTTYSFEAGAKLDVAIDTANKVTYSHETITTTPTTAADKKITFVSGITTDGYGHTTGYETAEVNFPAPVDISGKMDLVPEATAGHYAIFDENGQVIDGGYIDADLSVNDTFGSDENRPGVLGFNVYEKQTVDGVYEENPVIGYYLEVEQDSGLDLYGTSASTGTGDAANNKSRIAMGKIALSEATKESLEKADNAMPKVPEADEGAYAIFDANGQVVNGGRLSADVDVQDLSDDNDYGYMRFKLNEHTGTANSRLWFEQTLKITKDSGLTITSEEPTEIFGSTGCETIAESSIALSEVTKASLAKADTAVQEITTIDTSADHTHGAETNCGGLKVTQNKDDEDKAIPGSINIEIDDSITFILNCGSAADLL